MSPSHTLTQTCPWDDFKPAVMHFCERELCAWITQPANTWSNLAYLLVGAWLIGVALRERRRNLAVIGIIEIVIGVGSFLFHMSSTWFGEVLDVGGMYLLSCYVLFMNLQRYRTAIGKPLGPGTLAAGFLSLSGASIAVVAIFGGAVGILLFVALVICGTLLERPLYVRRPDRRLYAPLMKLLGVFALAFGIWWLDVLGVVCDPDNHWLQGHALWHLLNSLVFVFLYRFYAGLSETGAAAQDPARRPE